MITTAPSGVAGAAVSPPTVSATGAAANAPADQSSGGSGAGGITPACPKADTKTPHCTALVKGGLTGARPASPSPIGHMPAQFRGAYGLNSAASPGKAIVAVAVGGDHPNAKADLDAFSLPILPDCAGGTSPARRCHAS